MLRFNTFRPQRYLRSKFVEGKYLLASEATDLELELVDLLRKTVVSTLGENVALEDAWKVERLSTTQILIRPGEAWFKGLPFTMRTGKDQQVSGAILSLGTVPVGVTATDDANGAGKIITFNSGASTPSSTYKLVITAREELVTDVDDPFLKNVNLTESTAQKIRFIFQLNIVPDSLQSESSVPYRDEGSTSASVTNFPNSGGFAAPNFVNKVSITPSAAQNGELVALNLISGSEGIDGRDLELVVRNNTALGGGIVLPNSPSGQQAFSNGKLIDSNGTIFHINAIFNDTVSTQVVIRIDKEPDQPNPEIVNGKSYSLIKREPFVTDDVNGSPQGKLHWPIAKLEWNQSLGIVHDSKVLDLRNVTKSLQQFENQVNQKVDLIPTGGGNFSFGTTPNILGWTSDIQLVSAYGPIQTIPASSAAMLDGSALVYELNLASGGTIARGNESVTVLSAGSTINVGPSDNLADARVGNLIRNSSGEVSEILSINSVSKQLTITPAFSNTGAATIYKDAFAAQKAKLTLNSYVLAVRKNNKVWVGGGALELEVGEVNQLGDGIPQAMLTYLGALDENDSDPSYSSTEVVTQGGPLTTAISELDEAVDDILDALAEPLYDELLRVVSPGGSTVLAQTTTVTGNGGTFWQPTTRSGQGFIPTSTSDISSAVLRMSKSGSPVFDIRAEIYTDAAGVPGVLLGTSSNVHAASALTGSFADRTWNFPTGINLTSGVKYFLVLVPINHVTNGNLNFELVSAGYAGGNNIVSINSGASWTGTSVPWKFVINGLTVLGPNEVAGPVTAGTILTLPNNSRNSNNPQFYDAASGELEIFHNNLFKFQGSHWSSVDNQRFQFTYDLPIGSEIHLRIDSISAGTVGGGGGGGGSLQDSYNIGNTITTTSGRPFEISGPAGQKLFKVNGDIEITGVIDPIGMELTPVAGNPLAVAKKGIWVNTSNELIYENGASGKNLSQAINNLESGTGITAITRLMFNGTGNTIPKGTPVYSPSVGQIAPANGVLAVSSRVIGVTAESIPSSTNGKIAISGFVSGVTGFNHGSYIYLGNDPGELVDVEPVVGPYTEGFNIIIVGIMEGTNLILQIQNVGVL